MRESIGATWIFGIVIVFVTIFTGYLAFSINFSKAFAMKDEIIDVLEKYNGPGNSTSSWSEAGGVSTTTAFCEIYKYMLSVNYNAAGNCHTITDYLYSHNAYSHRKWILGVNHAKATVYGDSPDVFPTKRYNYCLVREDQTYSGTDSQANINFSTYRVIVFFSVNINIMNLFADYYVTGETKNITYPADGYLGK